MQSWSLSGDLSCAFVLGATTLRIFPNRLAGVGSPSADVHERRALELRPVKHCALEVHTEEPRALELRVFERGALELRAVERGALELRAVERGALQLRT